VLLSITGFAQTSADAHRAILIRERVSPTDGITVIYTARMISKDPLAD
jgi:hypothetical protein